MIKRSKKTNKNKNTFLIIFIFHTLNFQFHQYLLRHIQKIRGIRWSLVELDNSQRPEARQ